MGVCVCATWIGAVSVVMRLLLALCGCVCVCCLDFGAVSVVMRLLVVIHTGSCTVESLGSLAPLSDCKGCLLPLEFRLVCRQCYVECGEELRLVY